MAIAHGGVSAGRRSMNISRLLRLTSWKGTDSSCTTIFEAAKEAVKSAEQFQQGDTSTVEPKVSLSAALCAGGRRAQHRRQGGQ